MESALQPWRLVLFYPLKEAKVWRGVQSPVQGRSVARNGRGPWTHISLSGSGVMRENPVQPLGREDPWRRKWQPTPGFLPGKSHGQRSLVGYSPGEHKRVRHNWATKGHQQSICLPETEGFSWTWGLSVLKQGLSQADWNSRSGVRMDLYYHLNAVIVKVFHYMDLF